MTFSEAFGFNTHESIAVIGSHGKTSLCYLLSSENCDKKVALTTSTKIFKITKDDLKVKNFYDFYGKNLPKKLFTGVSVFGKFYKEDKISSLNLQDLQYLKTISDMLIYEADGSRCKPFKAWKQNEPVIISQTSVIVGIIPINFIGQKVDESLIHRFELFKQKFQVGLNDLIDENLFIKITHEMFLKAPKNARKILFLNRFESIHEKSVKQIAQGLSNIEICVGSIKNKTMKKVK